MRETVFAYAEKSAYTEIRRGVRVRIVKRDCPEGVSMTDYASMRRAIEETKESFDAVERFYRQSPLYSWIDTPLRDEP